MNSAFLAALVVFASAFVTACSGPAGPTQPGVYLLNLGDAKAQILLIRDDRTTLTLTGTWSKEASTIDVESPTCGTLRFREQGLVTYCDDCIRIRKNPELKPTCELGGENFPDTWISSGF